MVLLLKSLAFEILPRTRYACTNQAPVGQKFGPSTEFSGPHHLGDGQIVGNLDKVPIEVDSIVVLADGNQVPNEHERA